jgi:hypothetical protein
MMCICLLYFLCIVQAITGTAVYIFVSCLQFAHNKNAFFQGEIVVLKNTNGRGETCVSNEAQKVVPIYDLCKFFSL